jgi:hypothetical protein
MRSPCSSASGLTTCPSLTHAQVDFGLAAPPDRATCPPGSPLKGASEVARALGLARRLPGT